MIDFELVLATVFETVLDVFPLVDLVAFVFVVLVLVTVFLVVFVFALLA